MKKIECVIKPHKLDEVQAALNKLGVHGVTAFEVKGFGKQKGKTERYRGSEIGVGFIPKILLKIVIKDFQLDKVLKAIVSAARTGEIGDGKIFVSDIEHVIRIRTGEVDEKAL